MRYFIFALLGCVGFFGAVAAEVEPIRDFSEENVPGVVRSIDSITHSVSGITKSKDPQQRLVQLEDEIERKELELADIEHEALFTSLDFSIKPSERRRLTERWKRMAKELEELYLERDSIQKTVENEERVRLEAEHNLRSRWPYTKKQIAFMVEMYRRTTCGHPDFGYPELDAAMQESQAILNVNDPPTLDRIDNAVRFANSWQIVDRYLFVEYPSMREATPVPHLSGDTYYNHYTEKHERLDTRPAIATTPDMREYDCSHDAFLQ